jgi:ribosomal protein L32
MKTAQISSSESRTSKSKRRKNLSKEIWKPPKLVVVKAAQVNLKNIDGIKKQQNHLNKWQNRLNNEENPNN